MEIILNAGLGIGILMFFLLVFKSGKKREDYLFLCWILVTLLQITFYNVTIYHMPIQGVFAIFSFAMPILGAPLLFLYISQLSGHFVTWKTVSFHCSIYLIYSGLLILLQHLNGTSFTAQNGYLTVSGNASYLINYYAIPLAVSGFLYCIWDLLLLRRHRRTIAEIFSFDEKINLKWIGYVVYSYLILFLLASFAIFRATQFQLFPLENAFAFVGIVLSAMLVAFGFFGFRQTSIFSNIDSRPIITPKLETAAYTKSGLSPEKIKSSAHTLSQLMERDKPYLNEDLSLSLLADQSKLSQTQLSQIINQHFQMNFYDFVNQYRVEEAKKRLVSPDQDYLSVLGIAFDCGFKSKSSFNRYFKKYCGVSPSEFKNQNS